MSACPNCEWGMWTNSISKFVFRKILNSDGIFEFEDYNDIPASDGNIEEINRPTREGLRNAADDNLLFVFRTCHNYIYANDGMHKQPAFFEFLKIIFCKIQDERNIPEPLEFYATSGERKNSDGQLTVKKRISAIFKRVKESYSDIFDKNDEINLTPRSLAYIVSELQRYNLLNTNIDIKGKAYEEIVGANLRGDRGEFFTPRNITKMAVEMLNPDINERVLDSSCGTGGFLVTALTYMIDKLQRSSEEKFRLPREQWSIYQAINFRDRIREAAGKNFFGFDLNLDLAKATRMNMVMNNDGSGNIYQVNSLLPPHEWPDTFKANLARALNIDKSSLRNHESINLFDVIITNPPFGSKIPVKDEAILTQYELAHIWKRDKVSGEWTMTENLQSSVPPEILFVERCTQFLKDGGRMGIVLPDSILGSPGLGYIRHWILTNHTVIASIDLTPDTFQPHNGTQTSILILRKKTAQEKINEAITRHIANYPVFMAVIERVGHDRRGNTLYKRDLEGNELLAQDSGGKLERIIDDQTQILPEIFREWLKKKLPSHGQDAEIKFSKVWIEEILRDKDLRLEAGVFNNEARQAFMIIENVRFGAVKFMELASSYTLGRSVRVIKTKSPYPFYQPSSITDIKPKYDGYLYTKNVSNIESLRMHTGQVLLSCSGTIGRAVYVSKTLDNKLLSQDMIRIDCNNYQDTGFLYAYLKSSAGQKILKTLAYGAV